MTYKFKNILLLFVCLFAGTALMAQDVVSLEECQQWAKDYHPVLKQKELYSKISELELENNATNYLPNVNLNGQVTYQSDVTGVEVDLPNVNIPSASKDQYKMYLDVRQDIWDGGVTKAVEMFEKSKEKTNQQSVEVELYKIREQVNQFFFTSFFIQENQNILKRKEETLRARRDLLESGVKHGMVLQSDLDLVDAELVKLKQQQIELRNSRETVHSALAILTGKEIGVFNQLKLPDQPFSTSTQIIRPELDHFQSQRSLLQANSELIAKKRNPKLFGFGQAGYGKPGLNMLNDKFEAYYLVGVGLSWNVFDWDKTSRNKESISLQQEIIKTNQSYFERSVELGLNKEVRKIRNLEEIIQSDRELIGLQERITKSSASKLENGAITIADYLQDLNAEMATRITFETHKIQLEQAKINYQHILGN